MNKVSILDGGLAAWTQAGLPLESGVNKPSPAIFTATMNDGLIAFANGRMVVLRVPYPTGFYAKGFDGRIDDPNAGWKGRGIYSSTGADTVWHSEGAIAHKDGKYYSVAKPILVKFQIRPDPLAR